LIRDEVAGDPRSGRCWVRRSLAKLAAALRRSGRTIYRHTIRRLLRKHGIRLRSDVKHLTPRPHADRDRQFRYLVAQRRRFEAAGWPVISVDTKKKELIGRFKNPGRLWCAHPPEVYTHDFPRDADAKAVPYGVYDVGRNRGYVFVGTSGDTPDFAVAALVRWWRVAGRTAYPHAPHLLILADAGGSNGYRPRRWKHQLQHRLADAAGVAITVCHYPPGASKWNPIEHRLFSQISQTWAGIPLTSLDLVVELIGRTTTTTGLRVAAVRLDGHFPTGLSVSDAEMASLKITRHKTCPRWNYTIEPRSSGK
jgi:hypothetical protein